MKILFATLAVSLLGSLALAEEVDPTNLYDLSTKGTTSAVKAGQKGTLIIAIEPKAGAHVSDDAPLKIELTGNHVKPEKTKLAHADAKGGPAPRFEVPFTAESAGKGGVDAKMTFFICTEKICSRQQKTLSVPVEIQ